MVFYFDQSKFYLSPFAPLRVISQLDNTDGMVNTRLCHLTLAFNCVFIQIIFQDSVEKIFAGSFNVCGATCNECNVFLLV